jgi:Xaa-Pro aminopeptidase
MQHQSLPSSFHAANRAALAKFIGGDAVAVIDTSDTLTRSGDFEYSFHPDPNFFYLTGVAEPEAVLVLVPGHAQAAMRELLFISGTSEHVSTWEGERHTPEAAAQISGITTVLMIAELKPILSQLLEKYHSVYLNANESLADHMPSPSKRRAQRLRQTMPLHRLRSALPQLARQRVIKHPAEVDQLRRAIEITGAGIEAARRILPHARHEYELEAELTAEFIRRGSTNAFLPIVAAGQSATIIHHMKNNGPVTPGNLVLLDIGAESACYAADISRTIPVSGHFTDRQGAVYEAVWRVQQAAIGLLKPGVKKRPYEDQVGQLILEELRGLGLKNPDLRTHYPHSASHFLGLDVHDVGDYAQPLTAGMVITVEPGIYLREEGIGVRLEDDVLVTQTGCEVLSSAIPSAPEDIIK